MSVLVKREIVEHIKNGDLEFSPSLDELQFRPHSIDLRLGFTFRVPKHVVDKSKGRSALILDHYSLNNGHYSNFDQIVLKPGQHFDILPGESIMGFSYEKLKIKSMMLMGILYPRSSVNRRGLAVDLTGIIDAGYSGYLMFPIHNNTSMQVIRIYPGERICQVVFERLDIPVSHGYEGRYSNTSKMKTSLSYVSESSKREIKYIREGKINQLKKEFSFQNL